jgi:hypothetical protein
LDADCSKTVGWMLAILQFFIALDATVGGHAVDLYGANGSALRDCNLNEKSAPQTLTERTIKDLVGP